MRWAAGIAAIARCADLAITDGAAAKTVLVIEPTLRSIGVTTLFLERVGLDTTGVDGWLGTGAKYGRLCGRVA